MMMMQPMASQVPYQCSVGNKEVDKDNTYINFMSHSPSSSSSSSSSSFFILLLFSYLSLSFLFVCFSFAISSQSPTEFPGDRLPIVGSFLFLLSLSSLFFLICFFAPSSKRFAYNEESGNMYYSFNAGLLHVLVISSVPLSPPSFLFFVISVTCFSHCHFLHLLCHLSSHIMLHHA